uniref:Gustatory and odorant receptor 22 n=1 Tax=Sipha flava TaxID=143950 RepID=A0A2S2QVJ6_9HEMI
MFSKQIFVYKNNAYDRKNTVRIKNQKSTYFKQLKLNIIALKLFGVMPLTEDENGPKFKLFSWIMLYSFSIFVCLICLLFNKLYGDYRYYSESSDLDIFNFTSRIAGSAMTLVVFTIPFFWMDMKNIPNYWNRWNIFEDKFESCMRKPLHLNVTKRSWIVTILPIVLITSNIGISVTLIKVWKVANSILFITIFAIINLSVGYFHINCHIFRNISKDINQRLMELIVTKKSAIKFREHAELWCYMSHMITDFGIVHGGMFCSTAIVMYISSTITLFVVFMILISPESYKVSPILLPATFSSSILMIYSESAYTALSEIGPKLRWKILNLIVCGVVEQTQREVSLYSTAYISVSQIFCGCAPRWCSFLD